MNNHRLSIDSDSLEDSRETEINRLQNENKQKQQLITSQEEVVRSLRIQNEELKEEYEELDKEHQLLMQKFDRLQHEVEQKTGDLDSVTHALRESQISCQEIHKKLEKRTGQLQKSIEDLTKFKNELDQAKATIEELKLKTISLEAASVTREKGSRRRDREDDFEAMTQELHRLQAQIHSLKQQNEELNHKLVKATAPQPLPEPEIQPKRTIVPKRDIGQNSSCEQTNEEMVQELYDLRAQVKTLRHRLSKRKIDEEIQKLQEELEVTETSWRLERQHKERYARENCQLESKLSDINKQMQLIQKQNSDLNLRCSELESLIRDQSIPPPLPPKRAISGPELSSAVKTMLPPPPPIPPKSRLESTSDSSLVHDENRAETNTAGMRYSTVDEVGEFMDSSSIVASLNKRPHLDTSSVDHYTGLTNKKAASALSETSQTLAGNYCPNHRLRKVQNPIVDPITEQKLRMDRATELARRNMQTKPLHQTSYPLELDTFDTTNLTETDIKRGRLTTRPALADSSNQRKPVKKAEAFIV